MADPDILLAALAAQLHQARLAAGLTQEQVSTLAGLSRPRYREIEAGTTAARASNLITICRVLGLELMLIPQASVPVVQSILGHDPQDIDDLPAFSPMDR